MARAERRDADLSGRAYGAGGQSDYGRAGDRLHFLISHFVDATVSHLTTRELTEMARAEGQCVETQISDAMLDTEIAEAVATRQAA